MTKRQQYIYEQFLNSKDYSLTQVYKTPSQAKKRAFYECMRVAVNAGAHRCRILSHNCQMFSFAFEYEMDGIRRLHYRTHKSILDFVVD